MQGLSKIFFLCHSFTKETCTLYVAFYYCLLFMCLGASLVGQMVKNLPAMQKTRFDPWVEEVPMEKGLATYSSILAWRIPMDRGAWWATVCGAEKSQL